MSEPASPTTLPARWGTLSLDLDDTWAYLRTRGDRDWESAPTLVTTATERLLGVLGDVLGREGTRLTVFVVGRDARTAHGREAVSALAAAGHEIACHSDLHRSDLASLPEAEVREDVLRATDAIADVTGVAPAGFRCPSFGTSPALLSVLRDAGYGYDASVLPTSLGPLLRTYYRLRVRGPQRGSAEVDASAMFGPASNARRPLTPFRWEVGEQELLELPVSTAPLARTPVHMSYLQALHGIAPRSGGHGVGARAARTYLRAASAGWAVRRVPPSFLLHPTDLVDATDAPRLGFFPGMAVPWQDKVEAVRGALEVLSRRVTLVPLGDAARSLDPTASDDSLPLLALDPAGRR